MRIVARLDIKGQHVIKGIQLEGLRKVGDPIEMARQYFEAGIDEIVFMDAVASLYDQNNLFDVIEKAVREVFVPVAIGGGLRTIDDVSRALDAGADKVIINTGAVRNIDLVNAVASKYGSQCLIGSIEAKSALTGGWQAQTNNGREPTGLDVLVWARRLQDAGVGEILLTSVDQEGTRRGFDVKLIQALHNAIRKPIIVSGGYGKPTHLANLLGTVVPSALAFGAALHYKDATVADLRNLIDAEIARGATK